MRLRPGLHEQDSAPADRVALQAWHLAATDEGVKAADEGRLVSHDDVAAWVRSWGDPNERTRPL